MLGKARQKCTHERTHKARSHTAHAETDSTRKGHKNLCPRSANQTRNQINKPKHSAMKRKKCTDLELQRRLEFCVGVIISLLAIAILQNI